MKEDALREQIATIGKSLNDRGLAHGSAGNISVKLADGWLMTPTKSCRGRLDPVRISRLDAGGNLLSGDKPSKETFLHIAMYRERPASGAVVHLHSVDAVAVSCLADVDPSNVFPPITAYAIMQVGKLALVPYYPPGDESLAEAVRKLAGKHHAVLLANHGSVVQDPRSMPQPTPSRNWNRPRNSCCCCAGKPCAISQWNRSPNSIAAFRVRRQSSRGCLR